MKEFSDFEKRIINRIIELDDQSSLNVLGNILSGFFAKNAEYYIKVESLTKCSVQLEESYSLSLLQGTKIDKIKEILEGTRKSIFITVKLLEYLEHHNLLFSSGESTIRDIGMKIHEGRYTDSTSFDKEICELLFKYSSKNFIPSHSLRILRNNNFVSDEEVRHRQLVDQYNKTLKYSAIAICVSLLSVVVAVCVPVTTKTEIKPYDSQLTVTIDQQSLNSINEKLDLIIKSENNDKNNYLELSPQLKSALKISALEILGESKKIREALGAVQKPLNQTINIAQPAN